MKTLQLPFPNKITKPFLGTDSVWREPSLRKGPCGDYLNPHSSPGSSLISPARTLSPKFPESHKIIASSLWPGGIASRAPGSSSNKPPYPLPMSHRQVSWRLKQKAGIAVSHVRHEN